MLRLSGCDGVTGKGLKALAKHCVRLHTLELVGCLLIGDKDVNAFQKGAWIGVLKELSIAGCREVTDAGVSKLTETMGPHLNVLNISGSETTDEGVRTIVRNCAHLRELDISNCVDVSDDSVGTLVRGISCLTSLKLDGNPLIHARVVASYVANKEVLFGELAQRWLGYQPKLQVESLIREVEMDRARKAAVLVIQVDIYADMCAYIYIYTSDNDWHSFFVRRFVRLSVGSHAKKESVPNMEGEEKDIHGQQVYPAVPGAVPHAGALFGVQDVQVSHRQAQKSHQDPGVLPEDPSNASENK